jgi:hypothetical protein
VKHLRPLQIGSSECRNNLKEYREGSAHMVQGFSNAYETYYAQDALDAVFPKHLRHLGLQQQDLEYGSSIEHTTQPAQYHANNVLQILQQWPQQQLSHLTAQHVILEVYTPTCCCPWHPHAWLYFTFCAGE